MFRVLLRGNYVHFGINLLVVVFENPAFSLVCKLPVLENIELVTQTKSHEWRKNGKLIFSVSLVLCGCVRYANLHAELKTQIFQQCN